MKYIFTLFISLLVFGKCIAQDNYKPGYYINVQGDTTFGFINLQSNFQNSKICNFKTTLNSDELLFEPSQIKSYRISDGKYYISKTVPINENKQTLFLEYLVDGIVDLYYVKVFSNDYYFIEKDTLIIPLTNNEIEAVSAYNTRKIGNSRRYIGALKVLFSDSPKMNNEIDRTPFNYRALVNVTKDYHYSVCDNYNCIDYTAQTKLKSELEIFSGIEYQLMGLKTSKDKISNVGFTAGCLFRLKPIKWSQSFNFIIGQGLSFYNFEGPLNNKIYYSDNEETLHVSVKTTNLNIPVSIEYAWPSEKIKPFIALLYNNIVLLSSTTKASRTTVNSSQYYGIPVDNTYRRYQYSFGLSTGLRIILKNKNSLNIRASYEYRKPSKNANYIFDYSNYQVYTLRIGYSFPIGKNKAH